MPLQATSGAASYDAFGGGAAAVPQYIEDVFSTFLYSGNGSTQTITNGIDLSGKGGLTWIKCRNSATPIHIWVDSARGNTKVIYSNADSDQYSEAGLTTLTSTGFSVGQVSASVLNVNATSETYASWSFRKQSKFFDVLTYTGTGSNRTISHSLGSVPACIMVKRTDSAADWQVYHRSLANTEYLVLNSTAAKATGATRWNSTTPTSTVFSVGTDASVNASGGTYVAYLFAHNAGGFGLTGTDNVISCGSYTTDGSGNFSVNLGYEPQWVMIKSTNNTGVSAAQQNWIMMDTMRGFVTQSGNGARLRANTSEAESTTNDFGPTATGFESLGNMSASAPFIYIAIRRGPMKVPTDATKVFTPLAYTGNGSSTRALTAGFPVDMFINNFRNVAGGGGDHFIRDRLRGGTVRLSTNTTGSEGTGYTVGLDSNTQVLNIPSGWDNYDTGTFVDYFWQRAPSFFDEVCYTGTGSGTTITHNLGVTPELVITKSRTNGSLGWVVWTTSLTNTDYWIRLDSTMAQTNSPVGYGGTFSASNYTIANTGPYNALNGSGQDFVAYLFATCPAVSKVGSYTGTGTTLQVNCGFTAGSRFVLIKRTDSTGDWYVWDSARGIVSGNDSYLLLNSTAAEVTNTDYIDTYSAGFEISSTAPAAINASGGSFIFFAVA